MFNNYKVRILDGEEILFLTVDQQALLTREYARGKQNQQYLKKRVEDYLAKFKVDFNGVKVFLVVNGLVVGSLLLSQINMPKPKVTQSFSYLTNILASENEVATPEVMEEVISEVATEEETKAETATTTKNNNSTKTSSSTNKSSSSNNKTSGTTKSSTTSKATSSSSATTNNKSSSSTTSSTTTATKEATVTVYRTNGTTVNLTLNEYLIGVVGAEMPASFNEEALKSQAVVARTYALKLINEGRKLTDSVSTQAYKDNSQLKTLWGSSYTTYYNKIKKAVEGTTDEVIMYNNKYIDAVYHSTSNGRTSSAVDVWGNDVAYLKSVSSPWDEDASSYLRKEQKEFSALSLLLGIKINSESKVEVLTRTSNNSVKTMVIDGKNYTGVQIRSLLGLRSTDFDFAFSETGIEITTRGYGHGVGMSQYGANGMAKAGYKYNQIIKHYYTGVTIKKVSL